MALTRQQRILVERARTVGGGRQGVALDDAACAFLVAVIARDLDLLQHFPELPTTSEIPSFFAPGSLERLRLASIDFLALFERLTGLDADADTYFACLATLHKSRLKYERILQTQPVPTIDHVGPRALLEYGQMEPQALVGWLFWRKWFFDLDNRAGQETGYLFEPIIANALGGIAVSAARSPVRRQANPAQGRQVDCIREQRAYEIKIRVSIAASGQGRWSEELQFPADCRASGYAPVLIVLDPTRNPKLTALEQAFLAHGGEVFAGQAAWDHLQALAGPTMSRFLETYVHAPLATLLARNEGALSALSVQLDGVAFTVRIGESERRVPRDERVSDDDEVARPAFPEDVDEA